MSFIQSCWYAVPLHTTKKRTPIHTKKQSTVWILRFSSQWLKKNVFFLHVTPCALVGIYWRFGRTYRFHLVTPWGCRQHDPPKRWEISIILHATRQSSLPFFHTSVNFNTYKLSTNLIKCRHTYVMKSMYFKRSSRKHWHTINNFTCFIPRIMIHSLNVNQQMHTLRSNYNNVLLRQLRNM